MQLTVLGREGGYPRPGGACPGYLVSCGDTHVAVDLGAGTLARLMTFIPVERIDALVLSHLHYDHCSDALVLRYALEAAIRGGVRKDALPVYAPETPEEVRALFDGAPEAFSVHTVTDGREMRTGTMGFRFFAVRHPVETYGMRITDSAGRTLVYTGDTGRFDGLAEACRGADALLADTAFLRERDGGENLPHMTTTQVAELARSACVGRLYCTHLAGGEEIAAKVAAEVDFTPKTVVKDMEQYDISESLI